MNFDDIEYLQHGSNRQRQAYSILTENQILLKLKRFDPILAGTIPLQIDIENSDLDIICCFAEREEFQKSIIDNFSTEKSFKIKELQSLDTFAIVANFFVDEFEIEIFGQNIPTKQQFAYRHLIAEHSILNERGEQFRKQIIALKEQGHRTEPAFALALGLTGNPYTELLKFNDDDSKNPVLLSHYFQDL